MSNAKPDSLTKTAGIELSERELEKVSGGDTKPITQDVTVNKAKTADKAFNAMDAYIRS